MANNKIEIDLLANDKASGALQNIQDKLDKVSRKATKTQNLVGRLSGFAKAGAALVAAYKLILDPIMEREKYIAGLKTVATSQEDYANSLEHLNEIAKTLPFSMKELTRVFTVLRKKGINPLKSDIMSTIGDTAAALGQDYEQVANTLAHFMIGEYSYMKNIGIAFKERGAGLTAELYDKEGVRHILTFANKHDRVGILKYIDDALKTKYGGAAAEKAKTLGGAFNKLGKSLIGFLDLISNSAAFGKLIHLVNYIAESIETSVKNGEYTKAIEGLSNIFGAIFDTIETFVRLANMAGGGLSSIIGTIGNLFKPGSNPNTIDGVGGFFDTMAELSIFGSKNKNTIDVNINVPNGVEADVNNQGDLDVNETLIYGGSYGSA